MSDKFEKSGNSEMSDDFEMQKTVTVEEASAWAAGEFGEVNLHDSRRVERLVLIARDQALNLGCAMSLCGGKNTAQLISRFFKRKEVTLDSISECHKKRTSRSCREHDRIFAVQDTTSLNYTGHKALEGLGLISDNENSKGLQMHSVLAVTPGKTPLGLIDINIWARDPGARGKKKLRSKLPTKEKESYKWIRGLKKTESVLPPGQKVLMIGDRESDIYDLFAAPRRASADILVRVTQNRCIASPEEAKLFDTIDRIPELGRYRLKVPRQGKRSEREAEVAVKAGSVTLKPPANRKEGELIDMCFVVAREVNPPADVEPVEWLLLTTLFVNGSPTPETTQTFESAKYCIDAYKTRWVVEEFHKVLKSGCKVEKLQFETLDSLLPAIGLLCIIAIRILFLTKYCRESPDDDADRVSSGTERTVLQAYLLKHKEKEWRIRTVKEFVYGVARLGGYPGRKCDGPPGTKTLWLGMVKLHNLIEGYLLWQEMQNTREIATMS